MKRRIFVDARSITRNRSGIARYADSLMSAISALQAAEDYDFFAYRDLSSVEAIGRFQSVVSDRPIGDLADYLRAHKRLNRMIGDTEAQLFHSYFHITPRKLRQDIPTVVTLHDTIWIDHAEISQPNKRTATTIRAFAKQTIPDTLRRATHVICVSDATAERATEWIPRKKMTVIGHGVDEAFFEEPRQREIVKQYTKKGTKYICVVGNDKPYKNLEVVVAAFDLLDDPKLNLVLVGGCEGLKKHISTLRSRDRIFLPGMLSDNDLKSVLNHASAFVFPSLVEGFGLPILEAMASGVPTVISDLEPMRSVAGGASLLFDPFDANDLQEKLRRVLEPALSKSLQKRGLRHASEQTWEHAAKKTLEVYTRLLS